MLSQQAITQSMSQVGHCIDNCPTEGFWGHRESGNVLPEPSSVMRLNFVSLLINISHFYKTMSVFRNVLEPEPRWKSDAALAAEKPMQFPIAENKKMRQYKDHFAA